MRRPSVRLKENSSQRAETNASGALAGGRATRLTRPPSTRLRTVLTLLSTTIRERAEAAVGRELAVGRRCSGHRVVSLSSLDTLEM